MAYPEGKPPVACLESLRKLRGETEPAPIPPVAEKGRAVDYELARRRAAHYTTSWDATHRRRGRESLVPRHRLRRQTFHICQAFFPGDDKAWEKLQLALKALIDPEAFERMRGTISFPFQPSEHGRIVVKVIDFRGNEVMRVVKLEPGGAMYADS